MLLTAVRFDGSFEYAIEPHDGDFSHILEEAKRQARLHDKTVHFTHGGRSFAISADTELHAIRTNHLEYLSMNTPTMAITSAYPKWQEPRVPMIE